MSDLRGLTKAERWCHDHPVEAQAKIKQLEVQRSAIAAVDESARDRYEKDIEQLMKLVEGNNKAAAYDQARIEQLEALADARLKDRLIMHENNVTAHKRIEQLEAELKKAYAEIQKINEREGVKGR